MHLNSLKLDLSICQSVRLEFVCDFGCNKSPGEVGIFQDAAREGAGLVLRGAAWIASWYIPKTNIISHLKRCHAKSPTIKGATTTTMLL